MPDVIHRFEALPDKLAPEDYNFNHFRMTHVIRDVRRTIETTGIRPGQTAPGFELPRAGGGSIRLSALRGKPVLLHFGSFTWPIAAGSVEPLKRLHKKWGDQVQFLDVLTRQAHPGPSVGPYETIEEKMHDGLRHLEEDVIPYPVLVDDVEGRVHQVYGGLADPVYLIDSAGRVSLFNKWSNPEALDRAIGRLLAQGGYGVVEGGVEPRPAVGQILRDGWPAIRRGLPQSYIDLETAAPGSGLLLLVGHTLKPLLTRKARVPAARPERAPERRAVPPVALAAGAVAGAAVGLLLFQRLRR